MHDLSAVATVHRFPKVSHGAFQCCLLGGGFCSMLPPPQPDCPFVNTGFKESDGRFLEVFKQAGLLDSQDPVK